VKGLFVFTLSFKFIVNMKLKGICSMKNFKGIALITGASRGLGAEIARTFVENGYGVVVNYYQNKESAEMLVGELGKENAIALYADITNKHDVEKLVNQTIKHYGCINIIINNALINFKFDPNAQEAVHELSWGRYVEQFEGSVHGALNTIQAALPYLKETDNARVINIGTNLFQNPIVPYHQYTTGKAALVGFTRNMAKELGQYGITVNMVSGGLLQTTDASALTTEEVFNIVANSSALNRVTTPKDVAETVVFLGSDRAKGITGQNIVVDSGLTMN
jgi:3-oxoacyl-[acyl-carrier protein] reductase